MTQSGKYLGNFNKKWRFNTDGFFRVQREMQFQFNHINPFRMYFPICFLTIDGKIQTIYKSPLCGIGTAETGIFSRLFRKCG